MNKTELVKRLRQAKKSIEQALESLSEADGTGEQLGICLYCKKPIYVGEKVTREIHTTPCYSRAHRKVADSKTTWEALEASGRIGPQGKPGRKPISDEEEALQAQAAVTALESKLEASRKPKKKP